MKIRFGKNTQEVLSDMVFPNLLEDVIKIKSKDTFCRTSTTISQAKTRPIIRWINLSIY